MSQLLGVLLDESRIMRSQVHTFGTLISVESRLEYFFALVTSACFKTMALLRSTFTTLELLTLDQWRQGYSLTITLQNGTYTGIHQLTYGQDYFLGIPFAQSPLGDPRFRVQQRFNTMWEGSKNATACYPECVG